MKSVLIKFTEERAKKLILIKQSFEIVGNDEYLAIETKYDKEFLIELLDCL